MTFTEFKETIALENEKISQVVNQAKISNLFFYFDRDLGSGFMDNKFSPKSKRSFDYVIPAADYFATKRSWSGRWIDYLGFYDNNYEPCPITFYLPILDQEWELINMSSSFYAGSYNKINSFKFTLKNINTKEIVELDSYNSENQFDKVILNIKNQLEEKYKKKATLEDAITIAISAHKGNKDKAGSDYILHSLRIMGQGETEVEKICGVLHDVVEESDWTFEDIEKEGFSEEVISVLRSLTKESEEENYEAYIDRLSENPIAVLIKLKDLRDNMDITRLKVLDQDDFVRLNKYLKAYWVLKGES